MEVLSGVPNTRTVKIIDEFVGKIDISKAYTRKELTDILTEICKETKKIVKITDDEEVIVRKRGRPVKIRLDKDGNVKEKKKPTVYNMFIGNRIKKLKTDNPDVNAKELLKMASTEWRKMSTEEKKQYQV
jgi:RNase P/RNase MRP subunit p29